MEPETVDANGGITPPICKSALQLAGKITGGLKGAAGLFWSVLAKLEVSKYPNLRIFLV